MDETIAKAIRSLQRAGRDKEEMVTILAEFYDTNEFEDLVDLVRQKIAYDKYKNLMKRLLFESPQNLISRLNSNLKNDDIHYIKFDLDLVGINHEHKVVEGCYDHEVLEHLSGVVRSGVNHVRRVQGLVDNDYYVCIDEMAISPHLGAKMITLVYKSRKK